MGVLLTSRVEMDFLFTFGAKSWTIQQESLCLHYNTIAHLCFIKNIFPVRQENGTKRSLKNRKSHFGDHLLLQSLHSFKMLLNCFHYLKVLSNILFVFVTLLLFHLCHFILQLDDGSLNLIVLTNEGHPAAETEAETSTNCIYIHSLHILEMVHIGT